MKSLLTIILLIVDVLLIAFGIYGTGKVLQLYRQSVYSETEPILSYVVHPKKQQLQLFWKDEDGQILGNFDNLIQHVESKNETLIFATNGGMYDKSMAPQGLYIENHKTLKPIDLRKGKGNFYYQPNGVFYLTDTQTPGICSSKEFKNTGNIQFATQSGPMLVINGKIHPSKAFRPKSNSLNIRNGVGILPDNSVLFAMSTRPINFYDFAMYFKAKGCKNALYLDGAISKTYLPQKHYTETGGYFGVMIGVTQ
jgi:uncharacterized protein YigE (DUF2233 family)